MRTFILYLVVFRVALALLTRTYFQADEYFQALEPAHYAVFGYGHLTWEWTTALPIRSIIYPAIYIPGYWLLKATGLDRFDILLIAFPKVVHGVLSAGTDIGIAVLARSVLGNDYVSTTVILSISSFFNALSLSRSLSNSLETSLCSLAFAHYPWDAHPNASPNVMFNRTKLRQTLFFSALACMIRPTNAIIWVFLYGNLLWAFHRYRRLVFHLIKDTVLILCASLVTLFTIDSLYYKKPTLTPYNFLLTNLSSVSLFYGGSPWHFYLTQALPILCTTASPFTIHGIWVTIKTQNTSKKSAALNTMVSVTIWSIGIYSLAGHKEWRFIHPLLPLLHIFAAKSLVDLNESVSKRASTHKQRNDKPTKGTTTAHHRKSNVSGYALWRVWESLPIQQSHLTLLLVMSPIALYVVLFYCSGPISVLSYIRSLPLKVDFDQPFTDTIGFLTPCHSTPGHAYLHRESLVSVPGRIWWLGCEPPLSGQNLSAYQDQTDVFFDSPKSYLGNHFPPIVNTTFPPSPFPASRPSQSGVQNWRHEWPKHIILFGDLLRDELGVKDLLQKQGYQEVRKYGRNWEGEGKRKGGVRVWKWQG